MTHATGALVEQPGLPFDPAGVRRVENGLGTHVEPPLDQGWTEHAKLCWQARVVEVDNDLPAGTLRVLVTPRAGFYDLRDNTPWSHGWTRYGEVWHDLNTIGRGLRVAARLREQET